MLENIDFVKLVIPQLQIVLFPEWKSEEAVAEVDCRFLKSGLN